MSPTKENRTNDSGGALVLSLLRKQRGLYADLSNLAQRQRSLIAANNTTGLIALLGDRKKLTDSLVQVGKQITPHRKDWPSALAKLSPELRKEADSVLVDVGIILKKIKELDEKDARVLSTRKAKVAESLKGVQTQRTAVSAYASAASPANSRINRLDEKS